MWPEEIRFREECETVGSVQSGGVFLSTEESPPPPRQAVWCGAWAVSMSTLVFPLFLVVFFPNFLKEERKCRRKEGRKTKQRKERVRVLRISRSFWAVLHSCDLPEALNGLIVFRWRAVISLEFLERGAGRASHGPGKETVLESHEGLRMGFGVRSGKGGEAAGPLV